MSTQASTSDQNPSCAALELQRGEQPSQMCIRCGSRIRPGDVDLNGIAFGIRSHRSPIGCIEALKLRIAARDIAIEEGQDFWETLDGLVKLAEKMFGMLRRVARAGFVRLHPPNVEADDFKYIIRAKKLLAARRAETSVRHETEESCDPNPAQERENL